MLDSVTGNPEALGQHSVDPVAFLGRGDLDRDDLAHDYGVIHGGRR